MENLSNNIANKVASELNMDNDQKEVIAYGAFALLQTFLFIFLISIFGYLFHVAIEALIIQFVVSILRKYSGGAHASTPSNCTTIGVTTCLVQAIAISYIVKMWTNFPISLILGLIIFLWCYYIIYRLAPVDNPAKPIAKEEKKKRMKKYSFVILNSYLVIYFIFMLLHFYFEKNAFLIYALCINVGIAWQVFTLTSTGHLFMGKMDAFLNYIFNIRRK